MGFFGALLGAMLCFLPSAQSALSAPIACAHPQVCNLVGRILQELPLATRPKLEQLVQISGDQHEFEPSTAELKKLVASPRLVVGPMELHPWLLAVMKQRSSRPELHTISLPLSYNFTQRYGSNDLHALSHFWLYPDLQEQLERALRKQLREDWKLPLTEQAASKSPADLAFLASFKKLKGRPVVLTHDALAPLLAMFGAQTVALKNSEHHGEMGAVPLKALALMRSKAQVPLLWIKDTNVALPLGVKSMARPTDQLIDLDVEGKRDEGRFAVLKELAAQIEKAIP